MPFDLSTKEGQQAHYAAIRSRMRARAERRASQDAAIPEPPVVEVVAGPPPKYLGPRRWIFVASPPKGPNVVAHVINQVALKYGVQPSDLISQRRTKSLAIPRHEVFYRLRTQTKMSFPHMARLVGDRDHTTAQHAFNRYRDMLAKGLVQL